MKANLRWWGWYFACESVI